MAIKMIDDSKLQNIAVAIQGKDGGGKMTVDEMPGRIDNINGGGSVPNPNDPLLLIDWDGTLLYSYTYEDAQLISEFPDAPVHEGLTFQSWNWSEVIAKTWLQNHRGAQLKVGATYTPTDGQDHDYWHSPRLTASNQIYMQHRATVSVDPYAFRRYYSLTSISLPNGLTIIGAYAFNGCSSLTSIILPDGLTLIGSNAFKSCSSLTQINILGSVTSIDSSTFQNCPSLTSISLPNGLTSISGSAFYSCYSLPKIDIPASVTLIGSYAFNDCTSLVDVVIRGKPTLGGSVVFGNNPSNQRYYVHRSDLEWFETATNWSAIYAEGKIVAAADYIEYLQSIGINTSDFEGE